MEIIEEREGGVPTRSLETHADSLADCNQGDEIVVVDPNGRVVAKKGDFNGVASDGSIQGLLFPASVVFSPNKSRLFIPNLALYLPFAGVPTIAVDSGWTRQVQHNIAMIDIPPTHNHGRRGRCPAIGSRLI